MAVDNSVREGRADVIIDMCMNRWMDGLAEGDRKMDQWRDE